MKEKIKEMIINMKEKTKKIFVDVYITSKFLFIIGIISFILIAISSFDTNLDANGNLVTIRTLFSSLVGFLLEKTTRNMSCDDTFLILKNYFIGGLALATVIILGISMFFVTNNNNPSLILLKNLLFSSVGFLISSSKDCE